MSLQIATPNLKRLENEARRVFSFRIRPEYVILLRHRKNKNGPGPGPERKDKTMQPYQLKAQYYETDQMGIVHHSNYIRWFESARIDFMDQIGVPYKEMEASGIISPVLSASCKYLHMTYFGDPMEVTVSVKSYNGIRLILTYEVRNRETGILNASGETSHCFLNKEGKILTLKKAAPKFDAAFAACMKERA